MSSLGPSQAPQRPAGRGLGPGSPKRTPRGGSLALSLPDGPDPPIAKVYSRHQRSNLGLGPIQSTWRKTGDAGREDETWRLSGRAGVGGGRKAAVQRSPETPGELSGPQISGCRSGRPARLSYWPWRSAPRLRGLTWGRGTGRSSKGWSSRGWLGPGSRGDRSPFPAPHTDPSGWPTPAACPQPAATTACPQPAAVLGNERL